MSVWGIVNRVLELPMTERLGWTLLHFAWQGVAVALLLAVALAAFKASSARIRYFVACTALVAMAALPIVTFTILPSPIREIANIDGTSMQIELSPPSGVSQELPIRDPLVGRANLNDEPFAERSKLLAPPQSNSSSTAAVTSVAELTSDANADLTSYWLSMRGHLRTWLPAFVLFWLCGVGVLSVRLLWGWREAQRCRKQQACPVPEAFAQSLERISRQLGVQSSVELIQSALVEVPTVAPRVVTGGFVTTTTHSPSPKHSLLGIAPGEPVLFKFSVAGFEPIERRVTVYSGQTETIDVVFK